MGTKHRLSKDQRRKVKLKQRAKRQEVGVLPYGGERYRSDRWVGHIYATEKAVYETIQVFGPRLTNEHVRAVYVGLIEELRAGRPALLTEDDPDVEYVPGREIPYLAWMVRAHWTEFVFVHGPVAVEDWIGILRTLLHSLELHNSNTGSAWGYVAYLERFMRQVEDSRGVNPMRLFGE
jgi:hypothetical protein